MSRSIYSNTALSERWGKDRPFSRSSDWARGQRKPSLSSKAQASITIERQRPAIKEAEGKLILCPAMFNAPAAKPEPEKPKHRQTTPDERRALRALAIIEHRKNPVAVTITNPRGGFAALQIAH
jgi:hypothetical protein